MTETEVWRKSSYSAAAHQDCVEVAPLLARVGVRDTKNRANGHLAVSAGQWRAFLGSVKRGAF